MMFVCLCVCVCVFPRFLFAYVCFHDAYLLVCVRKQTMKEYDERNFLDQGVLEHVGVAGELARTLRTHRGIVERCVHLLSTPMVKPPPVLPYLVLAGPLL